MDKLMYVTIYSGYCSHHKAMRFYLRFTPPNTDLEVMNFPYGLSITESFSTKQEAEHFAPIVDEFIRVAIISEVCAGFDGSFDLVDEKDIVDLGIVDNSLFGLNPFELYDHFVKNDIKIEENYMGVNGSMVLKTSERVYFLSLCSNLNKEQIEKCLFKIVNKIKNKEPVKFSWN